MNINGKAVYFVAIKLLIRQQDKLLITHDIFGDWDIPGGRIKEHEFGNPLHTIAERKLKEELGPNLAINIKEPKVFFNVKRIEHGLDEEARIFAVGLEADYVSGNIELGDHHDEYRWVDIHTFKPESLFDHGWDIGLQDYLKACQEA